MNDRGQHQAIAKLAGLKRFNTDRPCIHGHYADRSVSNGTCCECARIRADNEYKSMLELDKQSYLASNREYNSQNKDLFCAYAKRTHAERRQRVPPWSERKQILQFYKDCPPGMVVDHIIPLRGKLVSGLHVLNNLQYLTEIDNLVKGNKYELF